jgi:hypothetical protein
MLSGDLIAFGGNSTISNIIKWRTRSPVSHLGVVFHAAAVEQSPNDERYYNTVVESTQLNGKAGVTFSPLSYRVDSYDGDIWWLPLSAISLGMMDRAKFFDFLLRQAGKRYDIWQAMASAIDWLPDVLQDYAEWFCSEIATAGLNAAGVIGPVNASETTPIDLCRYELFSFTYYQMKGELKKIPGYNSVPVPIYSAGTGVGNSGAGAGVGTGKYT